MVLPRDVCWSVNPVTYFGIPKYLNLATVIKIDTVYKYIYKTQLPISINNGLSLSLYIYIHHKQFLELLAPTLELHQLSDFVGDHLAGSQTTTPAVSFDAEIPRPMKFPREKVNAINMMGNAP